MKTIIKIRDIPHKSNDEYLKRFEDIRQKVIGLLTEGKITESQYEILNNYISEYTEKENLKK